MNSIQILYLIHTIFFFPLNLSARTLAEKIFLLLINEKYNNKGQNVSVSIFRIQVYL